MKTKSKNLYFVVGQNPQQNTTELKIGLVNYINAIKLYAQEDWNEIQEYKKSLLNKVVFKRSCIILSSEFYSNSLIVEGNVPSTKRG